MKQTITVTDRARTSELCAAVCALCALLCRRAYLRAVSCLKTAQKCQKKAKMWLNTKHDFYAADGDPISCTGKQFIIYNCIAAVVSFLLCIRID